ncbi:hypothetical protein O9H85_04925 [Paenibacillus filicis]|uniref:Uncharacterized protein n=1 Tax=Paenibacillus gyeongsangnamensis TaxID=3388067 RepID=A0ABT4Q4G9_9BACL|nr:hypothetical protein [Paenibacillus filicis]MCZ8511775.1 hypothetical protein [Paenibacillus filicis]
MLAFKPWTSLIGRGKQDSSLTVHVTAPSDYFKRADAFIEDVKYLTKQELRGLNKAFLAKLLFDNFLDKIREGIDLYDYLLSLREAHGSLLEMSRETAASKKASGKADNSRFQWNLSSTSCKAESDGYWMLPIKLHSHEAARVDVFFDDLLWKGLPLHMELEELLSLLFIEFIHAVRTGFSDETKQEIIDFILSKWEEH